MTITIKTVHKSVHYTTLLPCYLALFIRHYCYTFVRRSMGGRGSISILAMTQKHRTIGIGDTFFHEYHYRYRRYFFTPLSLSVSAILFFTSIAIDYRDTFIEYR